MMISPTEGLFGLSLMILLYRSKETSKENQQKNGWIFARAG